MRRNRTREADVVLEPLAPLPPLRVGAVEVVTVPLPLATPLRGGRDDHRSREVVLVHVRAEEADGWAEVAVVDAPGYAPETPAGEAAAVLALARGEELRGHHPARAALELAHLDAGLRAADRSLAAWLGATQAAVAAGATLGLQDDLEALCAEADAALGLGAVRLRLKVVPGRAAAPLFALRAHLGDGVLLQADANGTFSLDDPAHRDELDALDGVGLACLEQPLAPDDLDGHARLATHLATPICLDEPLTSVAALEAAVDAGACHVACCKPGRVGGWPEARRFLARCRQLEVRVWIGGLLETGVGRAANVALAALGTDLPMDLDPRGRFSPDLADPLRPVGGLVPVPAGPGTGAVPDPDVLAAAGARVEVATR